MTDLPGPSSIRLVQDIQSRSHKHSLHPMIPSGSQLEPYWQTSLESHMSNTKVTPSMFHPRIPMNSSSFSSGSYAEQWGPHVETDQPRRLHELYSSRTSYVSSQNTGFIAHKPSRSSYNCHQASSALISSSPSCTQTAYCYDSNNTMCSPPVIQDAPIDLSKSKAKSTPCPMKRSQLEFLLTKDSKKRRFVTDSGLDDEVPLNLTKKPSQHKINANTIDMKDAVDNPVQPVELSSIYVESTAEKVSQLLVEMVYKVFSITPFHYLPENDKVSLILNSWHRLLLWLLAKNHFSFHVTPVSTTQNGSLVSTKQCRLSTSQPSMAFVKTISGFIEKFQNLRVDEEELSLLFAITLFHCGQDVCCNPEAVESYRKDMMKQLQTYLMSKPEKGIKRYTELLLYLPLLYGVNEKMFERLFCSHLLKDNDIRIFLKEVVKRKSYQGQQHSSSIGHPAAIK